MKTAWKFYQTPSENGLTFSDYKKKGKNIQISDIYPLYALTHKKKYAEQFMKERDMSRFYLIKEENLSDEEYAYFANKNRSCVLQKTEFITYCEKKNKYVKTKINLLTTYAEEAYVKDTIEDGILEDGDISIYSWVNPRIFSEKYQKSLKLLKYQKFHDFVNAVISPKDEDDDYAPPELNFDEVKVFFKNYYYLFK